MRHYALSRLTSGMPLGVFPLAHAVAAFGSLQCRHKISSLVRGCCFVPQFDFDVAKISIFIYMFQTIAQSFKLFLQIAIVSASTE